MVKLIDSTDPDIYFIFTTRDGDKVECRCTPTIQYEFQVSFYINNFFKDMVSFSNVPSYYGLRDVIVSYLNNWFNF